VTVRLITRASFRRESSIERDPRGRRRTLALVNNMPDGAFDATERQYLELIEEGARGYGVDVRRYTMVGVPRGAETSRRIRGDYLSFHDIYLNPPDFLVVTGSNPIEPVIQNEPYWADLAELVAWARESVPSTLLSCLSAHAALTVFDGIERIRLLEKCTGVFPQTVDLGQPLTNGLESEILLPHSRWNSVPRVDLERVGYQVVIHSEVTGWSVASREEGGHQVVLVQGHPEYDPWSLVREYRRDAGRYVRHERDDPPFLPYHCSSREDWGLLESLQYEITHGERDPVLVDTFPFDEVGARAPWPWRSTAIQFFANWLTNVGLGED